MPAILSNLCVPVRNRAKQPAKAFTQQMATGFEQADTPSTTRSHEMCDDPPW